MQNNRLQFRHHTEIFETREEAVSFLDSLVDDGSLLGKSKMGEPIAVAYKHIDDEGEETTRLILAVGKVDDKIGEKARYQYIDAENILDVANTAKIEAEKNAEIVAALGEKVDEIDSSMIKGVKLNGVEGEINTEQVAELTIKAGDLTLDGYHVFPEIHELHSTDTILEAFGKLEAREDNDDIRLDKLESIEPDGLTIVKAKPNTDSETEYLSTALQIVESVDDLGSNQEKKYCLVDIKGNVLGKPIVIEKDSFLDSVELVEKDGKKDTLRFVFMLGNKEKKTVEITLSDFVIESEFDTKKGLSVSDGVVSVKRDAASENFFDITENGLRVTGIAEAIRNAAETEKERAETAEAGLSEKIEAETNRAEGEEKSLGDKISALSADVSKKISSAKEELKGNIDDAKTELNTTIASEKDGLTADINKAKSDVMDAVAAEKARAGSKESEIEENVSKEESRATEKETELEEEIEKLNGVETLEGSVSNTAKKYADGEKERAEAVEKELAAQNKANNVIASTPLTYGKSADGTELGLSISGDCLGINGENGSLTTTFNLAYDDENNLILLLGKNDKELARLSANPFIKDGMVSDFRVEVQDGVQKLVLEWNTDAGNKELSIPLTDIFSPYGESNGITIDAKNNISVKKDDTSEDAKYLTLGVAGLGLSGLTKAMNDAVAPAETRITTLESQMTGGTSIVGSVAHAVEDAVNAETARAEKAEADINTAIAEEKARALAEEKILSGRIETLNGDANTDGSVKKSILNFKNGDLISKTVTTITPDDAKNQTLLFSIGTGEATKIYASNDSKDMLYKGVSLEETIDALNEKLAAQEAEITELKALVEKISNIKITGVEQEIKVLSDEDGFTIGFADDAIFGRLNVPA